MVLAAGFSWTLQECRKIRILSRACAMNARTEENSIISKNLQHVSTILTQIITSSITDYYFK